MSKIKDVANGSIVSFVCYGGLILGTFDNVEVVGTIMGKALSNPSDAAINHANTWSSIPIDANGFKVNNDFTSYQYLILRNPLTGYRYEIGIPWIIPESFTINSVTTGTIIIESLDAVGMASIEAAIKKLGFTNVITQLS